MQYILDTMWGVQKCNQHAIYDTCNCTIGWEVRHELRQTTEALQLKAAGFNEQLAYKGGWVGQIQVKFIQTTQPGNYAYTVETAF